jgi:Chitinase
LLRKVHLVERTLIPLIILKETLYDVRCEKSKGLELGTDSSFHASFILALIAINLTLFLLFLAFSYLDFINLMAYDFHGKWESQVGHNAPLRSPSSDSEWRKQLSVENAANMWVRLGAPKEKLIIGMPTYGRTFTLTNPAVFKVNSPASGGGKAGEYTKESGFLAYYEVRHRPYWLNLVNLAYSPA